MELHLVFIGVGAVAGGAGAWLYFRQATQNAFRQALADSRSQRAQLETRLLLMWQRNAELVSEVARRERRIEELTAECGQQIERRAALEARVKQGAGLEESLAKVESRIREMAVASAATGAGLERQIRALAESGSLERRAPAREFRESGAAPNNTEVAEIVALDHLPLSLQTPTAPHLSSERRGRYSQCQGS